jgi:hypothetical protein
VRSAIKGPQREPGLGTSSENVRIEQLLRHEPVWVYVIDSQIMHPLHRTPIALMLGSGDVSD